MSDPSLSDIDFKNKWLGSELTSLNFRFKINYRVSKLILYLTYVSKLTIKRGCVFSIVIWSAFRMGQYRVNDHPQRAPQFSVQLYEKYPYFIF